MSIQSLQSLRKWCLVVASLAALPVAAGAEAPAVARPGLARAGESAAEARGLVFFIGVPGEPGVAAVGTAHTLPIERVAAAGRVDFFLGGSLRRVGTSHGFLVPPGKPFSLAGASIRGDFVVYAFAEAPSGVRTLEMGEPVTAGARVALLGVPKGGHDEDDIFGRVAAVTPDRIEVDLDLSHDLRGWGGAPLIDPRSGRVVGLLQATAPRGDTTQVIAAPIAGVVAALTTPLPDSGGRPFASFVEGVPEPEPPTPRLDPETRRRLVAQTPGEPAQVQLIVDHPRDGGVVADSACGAFVSGRAMAMRGALRRFDVVMVIDTSRSTVDPAGTDINGNGAVGTRRLGRLGSIFGAGSTDPGDSILAAEVAAARQLLRGLDPRSTRVSLVTFAGEPGGRGRYAQRAPAYTLEPLTNDYRRIDEALDDILDYDPEGSTHMAAGVDQATIELLGLRGALSQADPASEKVVFFFTDGQPTLPYGPEAEADNVRAVLRAAGRAQRGGIRIHSFAIGPDALEGPIATVEMASRTDGYFTPVRHPGDLVDVVEEVSFANLDEVSLWSETSGEPALPFRVTADGSWAGFVSLDPGENELRVRAVADDGATIEKRLTITFVPDAPTPPIPKALVVQRNRLLEDCLRLTKQMRIRAEREQTDRLRRELRLEVERERAAARERADQQRKQLEIGVGD